MSNSRPERRERNPDVGQRLLAQPELRLDMVEEVVQVPGADLLNLFLRTHKVTQTLKGTLIIIHCIVAEILPAGQPVAV